MRWIGSALYQITKTTEHTELDTPPLTSHPDKGNCITPEEQHRHIESATEKGGKPGTLTKDRNLSYNLHERTISEAVTMEATKRKNKYLTKEQELEAGRAIQEYKAARAALDERGDTLSETERMELLQRIAIGERAVDLLVRNNLALVTSRATQFKRSYPHGLPLEDLVQAGTEGLMKAVHKYDPSRNNKFSTMAVSWIVQSMTRESNKTARPIRLPENRIEDYSKILRVQSSEEAMGLSAKERDALIMSRVNVTPEALANIRTAAATQASLNRQVGSESDSDGRELIDIIADVRGVASIEKDIVENDMKRILYDAINQMGSLDRAVIAAAFGLAGEGHTIASVREQHRLTLADFNTILEKATVKLRALLESQDVTISDFLTA